MVVVAVLRGRGFSVGRAAAADVDADTADSVGADNDDEGVAAAADDGVEVGSGSGVRPAGRCMADCGGGRLFLSTCAAMF